MKNYERMWDELKRYLIIPPVSENDYAMLRQMAKIEVDENNHIPTRIKVSSQKQPIAYFREEKKDEVKGIGKFFKGK